MSYTIKWKHRITAANQKLPGAGMRSTMAWLLRRMADRIDGGKSIRYDYDTSPHIGDHQAAECIERGFQHANCLLAEMAHLQACEDALMKQHKALFADHASGAGASKP
ncbi:hypothetical protein [Halomonas sp. KO116]|uniref:hypothetical protein n=1 Tax=Halomonas sp. KO116 TaxID=1504981 RepID=UPI0004E382A8|nr:hypothetical protein [Halomonas sp. KO116]AJY53273.1 hypothetical protein KO116_P200166 [Halomonas sp. KO116]